MVRTVLACFLLFVGAITASASPRTPPSKVVPATVTTGKPAPAPRTPTPEEWQAILTKAFSEKTAGFTEIEEWAARACREIQQPSSDTEALCEATFAMILAERNAQREAINVMRLASKVGGDIGARIQNEVASVADFNQTDASTTKRYIAAKRVFSLSPQAGLQ
jgi:hypothetical protein